MKFSCQSCGRAYVVADDGVKGRAFRMRCKRCGEAITVRPEPGEAAAGRRPEPAQPARPDGGAGRVPELEPGGSPTAMRSAQGHDRPATRSTFDPFAGLDTGAPEEPESPGAPRGGGSSSPTPRSTFASGAPSQARPAPIELGRPLDGPEEEDTVEQELQRKASAQAVGSTGEPAHRAPAATRATLEPTPGSTPAPVLAPGAAEHPMPELPAAGRRWPFLPLAAGVVVLVLAALAYLSTRSDPPARRDPATPPGVEGVQGGGPAKPPP